MFLYSFSYIYLETFERITNSDWLKPTLFWRERQRELLRMVGKYRPRSMATFPLSLSQTSPCFCMSAVQVF